MPCPCKHSVCVYQKGQSYREGYFYSCWKYNNDEDYKAIWDGKPIHKPAKPSLMERVANFAYAIAVELEWRSGGGRTPTAQEKALRRSKCLSCEAHDKEDDLCLVCGCYLESGLFPPRPLGKLDCATQSCPRGHWNTVEGVPKRKCCGG